MRATTSESPKNILRSASTELWTAFDPEHDDLHDLDQMPGYDRDEWLIDWLLRQDVNGTNPRARIHVARWVIFTNWYMAGIPWFGYHNEADRIEEMMLHYGWMRGIQDMPWWLLDELTVYAHLFGPSPHLWDDLSMFCNEVARDRSVLDDEDEDCDDPFEEWPNDVL